MDLAADTVQERGDMVAPLRVDTEVRRHRAGMGHHLLLGDLAQVLL